MVNETMAPHDAPRVTVIIPVCNAGKYLAECLDSVLRQTLTDWEAICVNDGSTDRSPDILQAFAARDTRLRIRHNPGNKGPGYARNRGLEQARGKYVYFLDSDDMITPSALAELYEAAERDHLDAVLFDTTPIYETERLRALYENQPYRYRGAYEGIMTGEAFFWAAAQNRDYTPAVWRQFWRREFLQKHRISFCEAPHLNEDELFTHQVLRLAERVRHLPGQYHTYRRREGAVTATDSPPEQTFRSYFIVYCEILRAFSEHPLPFSPACSARYDTLYANELPRILRDLHRKIPEPAEVRFANPMHRFLYSLFRQDMDRRRRDESKRRLLLALLQKGNSRCFADLAWESHLAAKYHLTLPGLSVIEPEKNQFDLTPAFQAAEAGTFLLFFTGLYERFRPILLQAGYQEAADFADGRPLLEDSPP